ncbi:hypothetical protein PHLCEN_2v13613 [Hermanssonia centrifuga]|uniref:Amine oxidase domain-containing protein n=1 Tax=Hermanssonia centrifuga TaxID=98765 RepID=A0A2R6NEJ5_9APHY|nr:hypothetical protein PHLCEN_2v13613 [Hermanssonia centrifuga]
MKIAVVGSGVSGLAATWVSRHTSWQVNAYGLNLQQLLNEFSDHEVHLYEADSRPGGHANTVSFKQPGNKSGSQVDVDTGFIVFNPSTYPNFLRFLRLYPSLKSAILPTEMTFSVSRDGGAFEWAGKNLWSVFCQPARLLDRRMWRLLYDVLRFNACARRLVMAQSRKGENELNMSIGEYLEKEGYSDAFRDDYLIPMTAAIWSTPPDKCALDFPAYTLIQFLNNHHLLQVTGKPSWLTLHGGSQRYVKHILSSLPSSQLHLNAPVCSVFSVILPHMSPDQSHSYVDIQTAEGAARFDHVIMACHSDVALDVLRAGGGLNKQEKSILESFKWNRNEAVLHSDVKAITAQSKMHTIQNKRGISFAGAWLNYGFHEDGFTSGLRAALALQAPDSNDIRVPFEVLDADREPQPVLVSVLFDVLEGTGMRRLLGNVLGFWLDFWLMVFLGVFALFVRLLDG